MLNLLFMSLLYDRTCHISPCLWEQDRKFQLEPKRKKRAAEFEKDLVYPSL